MNRPPALQLTINTSNPIELLLIKRDKFIPFSSLFNHFYSPSDVTTPKNVYTHWTDKLQQNIKSLLRWCTRNNLFIRLLNNQISNRGVQVYSGTQE